MKYFWILVLVFALACLSSCATVESSSYDSVAGILGGIPGGETISFDLAEGFSAEASSEATGSIAGIWSEYDDEKEYLVIRTFNENGFHDVTIYAHSGYHNLQTYAGNHAVDGDVLSLEYANGVFVEFSFQISNGVLTATPLE